MVLIRNKSNKKGQMILGIMLSIFALMFALIAIPGIKDIVTEMRDETHLNCTSDTITTGTRMTCLVVDLYLPYFIFAVLAAGSAYLFLKDVGG